MASVTETVFWPPHQATLAQGTLTFDLAEPWYRSLPLSCITGLAVWVDGTPVPERQVSIEIGGVARTVEQCAGAGEEFWFVQDRATVRLTGVSAGRQARIKAHLSLRIPYIMVGPETALPRHVIQEETFEVRTS